MRPQKKMTELKIKTSLKDYHATTKTWFVVSGKKKVLRSLIQSQFSPPYSLKKTKFAALKLTEHKMIFGQKQVLIFAKVSTSCVILFYYLHSAFTQDCERFKITISFRQLSSHSIIIFSYLVKKKYLDFLSSYLGMPSPPRQGLCQTSVGDAIFTHDAEKKGQLTKQLFEVKKKSRVCVV